jgi:UDP-glucose 4-epimerase
MKRILLTGGNGFIGRTLLNSALASEYHIEAPSSKELNLSDTAAVDAYFQDRTFEAVIHSAVKPGHRNATDATDLVQTNLRLFHNLKRHRHRFGTFINLGSGAIYDTSQDIVQAKEAQQFERFPSDEHGFCKYVMGQQLELLPQSVNLHLFGIFGPHEDWQIRFISNAVCKTLVDLPITLRQNRCFSYLYAPDLVPVLRHFIEHRPQYTAYNVVPNEVQELASLAEQVQLLSGKSLPIHIAQAGNGREYTGCNDRLCNELGDLSFTPIQESVLELFDFYTTLYESKTITRSLLLTDK